MAKVKLGQVEVNVEPLKNSGDETLLELISSLDKMLRPWIYAVYAAAKADVALPKDAREQLAVLQPFMPEEDRWGPVRRMELIKALVGKVLERAGVSSAAPLPGGIADLPNIMDALWGRLEVDPKVPSPV